MREDWSEKQRREGSVARIQKEFPQCGAEQTAMQGTCLELEYVTGSWLTPCWGCRVALLGWDTDQMTY